MDKLRVRQILAIKIHVCKPKAKMVSGGLPLCELCEMLNNQSQVTKRFEKISSSIRNMIIRYLLLKPA